MTAKRIILAVVAGLALAGVLTLGGCGAGAQDERTHVASIDDATAPPAGDAAPLAEYAKRPQLRLDDPPERWGQLMAAYTECLLAHGATGGEERGPGAASADGGSSAIILDEPVPAGALEACATSLPREAPELDPALNPDYRDDLLAMVDCLKAARARIHVVEDRSTGRSVPSWTYDDDATAQVDPQVHHRCELEAFG